MRRTIGQFEHWVLRRRMNLVCKALGITPYPWQVEFVLEENPATLINKGKGSGKTTAVILRALVWGTDVGKDFSYFVRLDPDANRSKSSQSFTYSQYRRAYAACAKARAIPERPPLPPPHADPWYGPQYYSRASTDRFRQEALRIMREEKLSGEAQQHDEVKI